MIPHEPLQLDLVCPVCGALARRFRDTRTGPLAWHCPNGHRAGGEPITYRRWLAEIGAHPAPDEGGTP